MPLTRTTAVACALALTAVLTPASSQAQDGLYFGIAAGQSSVTSGAGWTFGPEASEGSFGTAGATIGYRQTPGPWFYAAELMVDAPLDGDLTDKFSGSDCSLFNDGPYFCSVDSTMRLRGVVGTSVTDRLEGFASFGIASVIGDSGVSANSVAHNRNTGITAGIGVQSRLASGGTLRGEVIYDRADRSATLPMGFDPDYEAVSLRLTYLFGKPVR
jgi:hypothetical protein